MKHHERIGILAAIIGNGIFGFSFMFSRIALEIAQPFVLLMDRFILAFALLSLLAIWARRKKIGMGQGDVHWLRFDLRGKPVLPLLCMGVVQPVAYFLCESYGIRLTNSTFAGVIIATAPLAGLIAAFFTLHEIPNRSQVVFSVLSIAGVVMMTLLQQSEGDVRLIGALILLGAVVSGTMFNVISRKLSQQFSALERTWMMMGVAAAVFTLLALLQCRGDMEQMIAPLRNRNFILALMYLGGLSSVIAFMALNVAAGKLTVAKNMAFCNLTTVLSLFAGVVFLHEPFSPLSLAASILIILGIWGVQRG